MRVELAYGRTDVVEVPDTAEVCRSTSRACPTRRRRSAAVRRPEARAAFGQTWPRAAARVAVVFPDLTRPMPNRTVLPPLLAELARGGVPATPTLLCATGTHRRATAAEMTELVGPDIVARFAIDDHERRRRPHVAVGSVDGMPVALTARYVEADLRILTGFVEPHFFAGFSGGPKGVCPGLAAEATILEAHSPPRIAHARATFVDRRQPGPRLRRARRWRWPRPPVARRGHQPARR